jgi:hypothetical protein
MVDKILRNCSLQEEILDDVKRREIIQSSEGRMQTIKRGNCEDFAKTVDFEFN